MKKVVSCFLAIFLHQTFLCGRDDNQLLKLFQNTDIPACLEFGIGLNTKWLIEHCEKVVSCELLLPEEITHSLDLTKPSSHWTPVVKQSSMAMQQATLLLRNQQDPCLQDSSYLLEIKEICEDLLKDQPFEMVLINPKVAMGKDFVNEMFDRVPIIVAYDTIGSQIYTPSNYEKILFSEEEKTTIWIHKSRMALIEILKGQPLNNPQKHLRIFFPIIHHTLLESFARTLLYLGHTLVVPGRSFSPSSRDRGFKISMGGHLFNQDRSPSVDLTSTFSRASSEDYAFLKNIEVIENDEILEHPPDVFVVNCPAVENDIYKIFKHLSSPRQRKKDIKIVHFSGNNRTVYRSFVKNLIAVDSYTAELYPSSNTIFWIPWIHFDALEYRGESDHLVFNNFLSHYYQTAFLTSRDVFQDITMRLSQAFPTLKVVSPPFIPRDDILSLIDQSCGTFHIKESEGFGYSIIESIAKGRPVFLKRSFSLGSRLMNWCIEGKTAFFFDDYEECAAKIKRYVEDQEYRHQVQDSCAATIRKCIDNEKQARILDNFLKNLN